MVYPCDRASRLGHTHDNGLCPTLLSGLAPRTMLLADRGYDVDWIRTLLYCTRNCIERFFNKIKHCRRIATRYDKLAANYLAFVQLVSIRLWLRVYGFTT